MEYLLCFQSNHWLFSAFWLKRITERLNSTETQLSEKGFIIKHWFLIIMAFLPWDHEPITSNGPDKKGLHNTTQI